MMRGGHGIVVADETGGVVVVEGLPIVELVVTLVELVVEGTVVWMVGSSPLPLP